LDNKKVSDEGNGRVDIAALKKLKKLTLRANQKIERRIKNSLSLYTEAANL